MNSLTPDTTPAAPDDADLDYEMKLLDTIETLDLRDDDSSDAIMAKIGTLFNSPGDDAS
jgi:hypothetical protein